MQQLRSGTILSTAEREQEVILVMSIRHLQSEPSEVTLWNNVIEPRRKVSAMLFNPWKCDPLFVKPKEAQIQMKSACGDYVHRRGGTAASQMFTLTPTIIMTTFSHSATGWPGRVNGLLSAQPHETNIKKVIVSLCYISSASLLQVCRRLLPQLKLLLCLWLACYLGHLHLHFRTIIQNGHLCLRAKSPTIHLREQGGATCDVWKEKRWKSAQSVMKKVIEDHSEGAQWKQAAWPV